MADGLNLFGYFVGFWLFLFSTTFRQGWLNDFEYGSSAEKANMILGAALSVFLNLVLVLGLMIWTVI